ncbi:MAG: sugar ABC transporter permease [Clostridiales bacterium]|jgi:ABC transporter, permease protein|nr:MAG: sugar ABC transporter permease [Clostridiales bacterium]
MLKSYKKSDLFGYFWILPAFLLICVFSVYPALSALLHSFTEWDLVNVEFIGIDNFKRLFSDKIFWKSCGNLLILMSTGLVLGNLAPLVLAELLHNLKSEKWSNAYRFIFVIPTLVPGMVNMLIWTKIVFNPFPSGLVNSILGSLFGASAKGWYFDENLALLSMVLTGFPWAAGTSFLIYLAGLNNISESVYEALDLDGITAWKRVFYIDLPLLKSQIKYFVMMGIIGAMQSFSMQLAFTKGGPNYATTVPGYYMYDRAFFGSEFGYAAAIGFFLFVVTLIVTIINNKFMKSTEEVM